MENTKSNIKKLNNAANYQIKKSDLVLEYELALLKEFYSCEFKMLKANFIEQCSIFYSKHSMRSLTIIKEHRASYFKMLEVKCKFINELKMEKKLKSVYIDELIKEAECKFQKYDDLVVSIEKELEELIHFKSGKLEKTNNN